VAETKEPLFSDSEHRAAPGRKHWLDYVDVGARVMLPAVAIWWAISSFHHQDIQNEKHLSIQITQQNDMMQSQRETAEAQLASSLLTWFKCESAPQRLMAQQILGSVSPKQAFLVNSVLAKCAMAPKDRESAEKYSLQNSLNELKQDFLQQLNLARQYRSVGLQRRAVEEYERAYNELPEAFRTKADPSTAAEARKAMQDGEFTRASDLFEQLFQLIETP
jgi:tetratricopeptide (TPR) repeat protein